MKKELEADGTLKFSAYKLAHPFSSAHVAVYRELWPDLNFICRYGPGSEARLILSQLKPRVCAESAFPGRKS